MGGVGDGEPVHCGGANRLGDVAEAVTATIVDKLTVANPAHLAIPD